VTTISVESSVAAATCGQFDPSRRRRTAASALQLIATSGPSALTFRSVARAAGISISAARNCFPTMSELLCAAIDLALTVERDRIARWTFSQNEASDLRKLATSFFDYPTPEQIAMARLNFDVAANPDTTEQVRVRIREYRAIVTDCLERCIQDDSAVPVDVLWAGTAFGFLTTEN
jgi:AcrR family transcriptional regulator